MDEIWTEGRPPLSNATIFVLEMRYTGWKYFVFHNKGIVRRLLSSFPSVFSFTFSVPSVLYYFIFLFNFFSGKSWEDKIKDLREQLISNSATAFIVYKLDEVACK